MTGYGKRGKPKAGFPSFPTALGNRAARFPHSRSPGGDRVEKWKSKSKTPTFPQRLVLPFTNSERRLPLSVGFAAVQAHRSIRICSPPAHPIGQVHRNLSVQRCWLPVPSDPRRPEVGRDHRVDAVSPPLAGLMPEHRNPVLRKNTGRAEMPERVTFVTCNPERSCRRQRSSPPSLTVSEPRFPSCSTGAAFQCRLRARMAP